MYAFLDPKADVFSSWDNVEHCIADIQLWMTNNILKLNGDKTSPTDLVRNLGVVFETFTNMNDHVTSVCRATFYHTKNIQSVKQFPSEDALIIVVHAFVTSRNSLLCGIADYNISRLQIIQNGAARMVTNFENYTGYS